MISEPAARQLEEILTDRLCMLGIRFVLYAIDDNDGSVAQLSNMRRFDINELLMDQIRLYAKDHQGAGHA